MRKKIQPGDIISYNEMCVKEGVSLQRGMNYRVNSNTTIILMSKRAGAPYEDQTLKNGQILVYEGHDVPKNESKEPKRVDQKLYTPNNKLTQNGKFYNAVIEFKKGERDAELVNVYEKIKDGIWVYNGVFELIDVKYVKSEHRKVFKFTLQITDKTANQRKENDKKKLNELSHNRMIPSSVKLAVWERDKGRCVKCGSTDNLHFDHELPFSKGGTSLKKENIRLLCARHNLQKSNKIE